MGRNRTFRNRKKRRQLKAVLKNGKAAKPKHSGKSGRTGSMHSKKLASKRLD